MDKSINNKKRKFYTGKDIIRIKKTKNFTTVSNKITFEEKLSARAIGIYFYLMTKPDDWQIRKTELYRHFKEGKQSINTAWKELIACGYAESKKLKNERGQYTDWKHSIFESPINKESKPKTEKPMSVKQPLLNTNKLPSIEISYKSINTNMFDKINNKYSLLVSTIIKHYFSYYKSSLLKQHPYLKSAVLMEVADRLSNNVNKLDLDFIDIWDDVIEDFFSSYSERSGTDFNICHFSSGKIIEILIERIK